MADKDKMPEIGEAVIYCDPRGEDHQALIVCVHGLSCVNLVYVSNDAKETDQYGRQISRQSSCQRIGPNVAHGNYFRYADDEKKPYQAPVAS